MLNEIEVAVWHIINKEIELVNLPNDQILQRLMMTALKAKKIILDQNEMIVFIIYLGHNYPKLMQSFYEWEEDAQIDDDFIEISKLNEWFKSLYTIAEENTLFY